MTEFLHQDRLRLIARVVEHSRLETERQIPALVWTVDAESGRPVGRWVLDEEPRTRRFG